jgi:hypothetical protein
VLRLSRINESITLKGLPRTRVANQTSPAPIAHPTSRSRLEYDKAKRRRYVATIASSIASARPAKVSPFDQYAKHAVALDPDEYSDRRREHGYAGHESPSGGGRGVGAAGGEQYDSADDKDDLSRRANRNIDHHAGGGLRARNAALMRKSRADDVAAHASDRQQRADGFADPTHPKEAEAAGTPKSREQLSPGDCVKIHGEEMI